MFHFKTKYYQWFLTTRYTNVKAVMLKWCKLLNLKMIQQVEGAPIVTNVGLPHILSKKTNYIIKISKYINCWGKGAHNAWSFRVNGLFGSVFTYVLSVFFL